ncbi:MAG: glycosyltransferase family 39 protein [Patescibacteria group bacterium]|nr:glycosyltransferase family 39 protein [Patescibacteria group bacterium]
MSFTNYKTAIILAAILLLGFGARLYKINNPVADWHSWRQADTAAVARNFVKMGFTPLVPRFDDLSNVASGRDNPSGYRMVEFPLYQSLGFGLYKIYPGLSLEIWLRLVTIFFSLLSGIFIYLLIAKYISRPAGIFGLAFYLFLPYSIYYGRTILPDVMSASLALGAIYFFDKVFEYYSSNIVRSSRPAVSNNKFYYFFLFISAVFAACALLVKPMAGFLFLPIVYLAFKNKGLKVFVSPSLYFYGFVSLLPFVLWRLWIAKFPEGIPASDWLLNGGNIRFTGAFFRWILAERLGKLILGYGALVFFFAGIMLRPAKKEGWLFWSLLTGTALYVIVFARGNVQHDYYQILIIPAVAVFCAKGLDFFVFAPKEYFSRFLTRFVALVLILMALAFSWYEVRGYYWINHPEIVEAGQAVDKLTPKDAKVIAPYGGDTAFLYQTNRQGWPVVEKNLPEMIQMGAGYLVIADPDKNALDLAKTYKVLEKKENYIIFKL